MEKKILKKKRFNKIIFTKKALVEFHQTKTSFLKVESLLIIKFLEKSLSLRKWHKLRISTEASSNFVSTQTPNPGTLRSSIFNIFSSSIKLECKVLNCRDFFIFSWKILTKNFFVGFKRFFIRKIFFENRKKSEEKNSFKKVSC